MGSGMEGIAVGFKIWVRYRGSGSVQGSPEGWVGDGLGSGKMYAGAPSDSKVALCMPCEGVHGGLTEEDPATGIWCVKPPRAGDTSLGILSRSDLVPMRP